MIVVFAKQHDFQETALEHSHECQNHTEDARVDCRAPAGGGNAATASRLARRLKRGASLQPAPNPRKSGRGKLAPWHDFLIELVTQDPDITLAELRGALEHAHGVRASISGVDQALRRNRPV